MKRFSKYLAISFILLLCILLFAGCSGRIRGDENARLTMEDLIEANSREALSELYSGVSYEADGYTLYFDREMTYLASGDSEGIYVNGAVYTLENGDFVCSVDSGDSKEKYASFPFSKDVASLGKIWKIVENDKNYTVHIELSPRNSAYVASIVGDFVDADEHYELECTVEYDTLVVTHIHVNICDGEGIFLRSHELNVRTDASRPLTGNLLFNNATMNIERRLTVVLNPGSETERTAIMLLGHGTEARFSLLNEGYRLYLDREYKIPYENNSGDLTIYAVRGSASAAEILYRNTLEKILLAHTNVCVTKESPAFSAPYSLYLDKSDYYLEMDNGGSEFFLTSDKQHYTKKDANEFFSSVLDTTDHYSELLTFPLPTTSDITDSTPLNRFENKDGTQTIEFLTFPDKYESLLKDAGITLTAEDCFISRIRFDINTLTVFHLEIVILPSEASEKAETVLLASDFSYDVTEPAAFAQLREHRDATDRYTATYVFNPDTPAEKIYQISAKKGDYHTLRYANVNSYQLFADRECYTVATEATYDRDITYYLAKEARFRYTNDELAGLIDKFSTPGVFGNLLAEYQKQDGTAVLLFLDGKDSYVETIASGTVVPECKLLTANSIYAKKGDTYFGIFDLSGSASHEFLLPIGGRDFALAEGILSAEQDDDNRETLISTILSGEKAEELLISSGFPYADGDVVTSLYTLDYDAEVLNRLDRSVTHADGTSEEIISVRFTYKAPKPASIDLLRSRSSSPKMRTVSVVLDPTLESTESFSCLVYVEDDLQVNLPEGYDALYTNSDCTELYEGFIDDQGLTLYSSRDLVSLASILDVNSPDDNKQNDGAVLISYSDNYTGGSYLRYYSETIDGIVYPARKYSMLFTDKYEFSRQDETYRYYLTPHTERPDYITFSLYNAADLGEDILIDQITEDGKLITTLAASDEKTEKFLSALDIPYESGMTLLRRVVVDAETLLLDSVITSYRLDRAEYPISVLEVARDVAAPSELESLAQHLTESQVHTVTVNYPNGAVIERTIVAKIPADAKFGIETLPGTALFLDFEFINRFDPETEPILDNLVLYVAYAD